MTANRLHAQKPPMNVLALVQGGERFIFLYDDESGREAMETFGRFANDPELNFSWDDALLLGEKLQSLRDHKDQA